MGRREKCDIDPREKGGSGDVVDDSRVCCNLTGKSSGTSAANKLDLVEV
jgi:hypothetical protein